MDPHSTDALQGLRAAAQHLDVGMTHILAAVQETQAASQAIIRTVDAVLAARTEREDLRESVARLEAMVLDLSERLRRQEGGG